MISVTPQQQNVPLAILMAIAIKIDDVSFGLGITSDAHYIAKKFLLEDKESTCQANGLPCQKRLATFEGTLTCRSRLRQVVKH